MRVTFLDESNLSTKERNDLSDDVFGVPETRSYPMPDASHVQQAVNMFGFLKDKSEEEELASNIIKFAKKYKMMDTLKVGKKNRFYKFWKDVADKK